MLGRVLVLAISVFVSACGGKRAELPMGTAWTPAAWRDEQTIVLHSDCPDGGDYWFPVWVVVVDDQVYVRLGKKATARMQCTRTMPLLDIQIAGKQFDKVRSTEVPDAVTRVNEAMADKYWTDIFVRGVHHPLTLRLAPDTAAPPAQR